MDQAIGRAGGPGRVGWVTAFTPKLVTVFREGYRLADLRADAVAGLTVAIVALPLSMAIAIASGLTPERGLYTAIVGGFVISVLGGSRHQIGGPAGAFIVLIAGIVERQGYGGLVQATCLAGALMCAAGFLRAGKIIHFMPYPVLVGFTAGIALIIFASQIRDVLGIELAHEPAALLAKASALWQAASSIRPATVVLSAAGIAVILVCRWLRPTWPAFLIAVVVLAAIATAVQLDTPTIGSRFGGLPGTLPAPHLPTLDGATLVRLLPDAAAIALLGAIESLLCALVADGMTGRRHRSDAELVAQGMANIAAASCGGLCATGTIARTATNIRAGARTPVAGILHALYLALFVAVAAPLAAYIPLAALGAVLMVVAWNMSDLPELWQLLRTSRSDAIIAAATFLLTAFWDLTAAIGIGVLLSLAVSYRHVGGHVEVSARREPAAEEETAGGSGSAGSDAIVYRIGGALHFMAVPKVTAVLDRVGATPRTVVLDVSDVRHVDSSAAKSIARFAARLAREGSKLRIAGARTQVRRELLRSGARAPLVRFIARGDVDDVTGSGSPAST